MAQAFTQMGDAYTDADGWYLAQIKATGSKTNHNGYRDQNNNNKVDKSEAYPTTQMGACAGKWAKVNWTVVDPIGYQGAAAALRGRRGASH